MVIFLVLRIILTCSEYGPDIYDIDNSLGFNVHTIDGDVHLNVVGKDDDNEGDDELRDQVYLYVQELAKQYPFINWYIEGARL